MSGRIHQIQLAYSQEEDRLLLRVTTSDSREYRLWLTRRFVRRLWPVLDKAMMADTLSVGARDPGVQREVRDYLRREAVAKGDFATPFQEEVERMKPLGEEPILACVARLIPQGTGNHQLSLHPRTGNGLEINLDRGMMHSFCQLLWDAIRKTDWDLMPSRGPVQEGPDLGGADDDGPTGPIRHLH
ncbi:MAG: hypothetical protein HQL57_09610 [Magnetococcales bacterium]|nr:hypothetical protein [Magnetococcales bacterium]MBF0157426.1 hypothetical protein [Magnetococcales bacterium]